MTFQPVDPSLAQRLLALPKPPIRAVLDTDAYNEVDDQFALAHACLSTNTIELLAVCAAPFHNARSQGPGDGMRLSHEEIQRLLPLLGMEATLPVLEGSRAWLPGPKDPVESEAAHKMVALAHASPPHQPLYILAIGAATNVASAILLDPSIRDKVVIVWLGGHALHAPRLDEFNLRQDVLAAQVLFDSGVALVHVPCWPVASHLATSVEELEHFLAGKNRLCDDLIHSVRSYEHRPAGQPWAKVIWDLAVTAWLVSPEAVPSSLIPSPILQQNLRWSFDRSRHLIRQVDWIERDQVFRDVFARLASFKDPKRP